MYIEDKENFVKELGELLSKYGVEQIEKLTYLKNNDLEFVKVDFVGGGNVMVNVHMDSLAAIVRDVMRALY